MVPDRYGQGSPGARALAKRKNISEDSKGRGKSTRGRKAKLWDLADRYATHLESERRSPPTTIRAYTRDVTEFLDFLEDRLGRAGRPGDLDILSVRAYLASLFGRNSPTTIGRKLSSLRGYFGYLVRRKVLADNPALLVAMPKKKTFRISGSMPKVLGLGWMAPKLPET